ncbi:hypothetical protein DPEC_G00299920 [Dallia pectoralis]|uniref:Uncharacterized protein n=1 Tax=Dallia pectoralis TaxID=75939 RepID=A0ACC2FG92_DALPE|nr:hypothetical protein DPEC_G00299920 [Dallia pectoralis]
MRNSGWVSLCSKDAVCKNPQIGINVLVSHRPNNPVDDRDHEAVLAQFISHARCVRALRRDPPCSPPAAFDCAGISVWHAGSSEGPGASKGQGAQRNASTLTNTWTDSPVPYGTAPRTVINEHSAPTSERGHN